MKDGKPNNQGDPESRRPGSGGAARRGSGPKKQRGFIERATAHGHSGHGAESVRPHLRDQLKLKALLATPFQVPGETPGKDEHHR